jgi:sulfur relay (sulfurtransferase) DsrF/TusC family protein
MTEKNVIIIIKSQPFSNLNYYEALRTAVGLWEHIVKILWRSKGVHATIKKADNSITKKFFDEFFDLDIELYVDRDEIVVRGFTYEDILDGISPIDDTEILALIEESDASLVF